MLRTLSCSDLVKFGDGSFSKILQSSSETLTLLNFDDV